MIGRLGLRIQKQKKKRRREVGVENKPDSSKSMEKLDSIRRMLESGGSKVEGVKDRRKMIVKTGELSHLAASKSRQLSGGQNQSSSAHTDPASSLDAVMNEDIMVKLPLKQQRE